MKLEFKNATLQRLLVFTRKNLLKYWMFKIAADLLLRTIQKIILVKSKNLRKVHLEKFSQFRTSFHTYELKEPQIQRVTIPEFFGNKKTSLNLNSDLEYLSRSCTVAEISNVQVFATTDFIIKDNIMIYDDEFIPERHVTTVDRFGIGKFNRRGNRAKVQLSEPTKKFKKAINLTAASSGNFAHFLMETIPKLAYLDSKNLYLDYPVLFDGYIGPRLVSILKYFNRNNRELVPLKKFEQVDVESLIQINSPTYCPMDLKREYKNSGNSTIFSKDAAQLLRNSARVPKLNQIKKIYIYRSDKFIKGFLGNSTRGVINQGEVIKTLKNLGFEIVDLKDLSFVDQIKLFPSAKVVVAPIGAALTNAIFTQPGAKIVALASFYPKADFTYHSRMMSAFERDFSIVLGHLVRKRGVSKQHSPYIINTDDLAATIKSLELNR